ncbi:MAG: lysozyme inhibitor LprI family protein [Bdellovibrio sp.]
MNKLVIALTVLVSTTAFGKGKSLVDKCLEKAENTYAMLDCISQDHDRKDKKLNDEYKALMAGLEKDVSKDGLEIRDRVLKAERAWIKYRDTSCKMDGIEMLGGTGESLIVGECLNKMTQERTNYLVGLQKTLLSNNSSKCEEGDISCNR